MNVRFSLIKPLFFRSYSMNQSSNMYKLIARSIPQERISFNFSYGLEGKLVKSFCLERLKTEKIEVFLERVRKNLSSKLAKSKKKETKAERAETVAKVDEFISNLSIYFEREGLRLKDDQTIEEACAPGSVFCIGDKRYKMDINPPRVNSLKLPKHLMVGFPVNLRYEMEFAQIDDSDFLWYRTSDKKNEVIELGKFHPLYGYTPTVDDIGFKLSVTCTPRNGNQLGEEKKVVSDVEVGAGPGICPFQTRHVFTSESPGDGSFRVVTYNILADCYADTEFSKTTLYSYCASYALALDYRIQLLSKEIQGYNADLICLQEVDRKVFNRELLPVLSSHGYEGQYKEKLGNMAEGEAIFFRTSRFRLEKDHSIGLTQQLKSEELYSDILSRVSQYPAVIEELEKRHNILQVLVLENKDNPKQKLCVANTHFFFHRDADHIRVIQGAISLLHLQHIVHMYQDQGVHVSLLFCGDFNANPKSACYHFMTQKEITSDHWHMTLKDTGEKLDKLNFSHNFHLRNACGETRYTNYVGGFCGVLDYMFIDQSLEVTSVVPMPTHGEVIQYGALPSVLFPSDHIAQICDLTWKEPLQEVIEG